MNEKNVTTNNSASPINAIKFDCIVSEEHNILIKATDDSSKFIVIRHDDETNTSIETIIDKPFNNIFEALNYAINNKIN